MKRLLIRFLFWLLRLLGVQVEWATPLAVNKVVVPQNKKCTVRKYTGAIQDENGKILDTKELVSHSICDGSLLTPQQAREKMGVRKLVNTEESVHFV